MDIDIYDSYALAAGGRLLHFDILVAAQTPAEQAFLYGQQWLHQIHEHTADLSLERCKFCHSEAANPEVELRIQQDGYFIIQMEGCPAPINH